MGLHAAVFLLTFSGLIFEIGLTRIYSATIWYHFAFLAVSVALLGWGLGGALLHAWRHRVAATRENAALLAALYAVAIPLCLWVMVQFPFRLERLPLYFAAPLVPFLLAGMAMAMIFHLHRDGAARLYFADLAGAALGAVTVTMLLEELGGEATLLLSTLPPLAAAACLSPRGRVPATVVAALVAAVALLHVQTGALRVSPGSLKAMPRHMDETPGARVTQTGWNSYSRIDAVEGFAPPSLARLYIDADAWTDTLAWDGRIESLRPLRTWYRALPFRIAPPAGATLVIGPGGGSDVLVALASGSRRVTVVEMNPLMIDFVRRYGARAGHLYDRPEVEVISDEGRTFISRTDRRFDTIFLGFVDTWASVASGGLSLSENYLYTTEALRAYYDRLTADGVLAILRWEVDLPGLVSNAVHVLGVEAASTRLVAVIEDRAHDPDHPPQMIFMLRRRPFTPAELDTVLSWPGSRPLLIPGRHAEPPFDDLFAGRSTLAQIADASPQRIGPVHDDSPFFFARDKPFGLPAGLALGLGGIVAGAAVLLVLLVAGGRPRTHPARAYRASVVYFACLGAGFIAIELALLQYFTLLVGHPVFTLSILLFTILASGGVGSRISAAVPMRRACLAIAGLGAVTAWGLPGLVQAALPLETPARIAIAMGVIAPLGVLMGMPFPQGLRRTGQGALPPPPFYWGLNGVMSVIGSIATVLVALHAGVQTSMLAGCMCYLVAAVASRRFEDGGKTGAEACSRLQRQHTGHPREGALVTG
jgi:hypothetical protein